MAKTYPSTVRFTDEFKKMIELLMRHRRFNDRTAYLEQLVREDWDDRVTPDMEAEMNEWLALRAVRPAIEKAVEEVKATTPESSPRGKKRGRSSGSSGKHESGEPSENRKMEAKGISGTPRKFPGD